MIIELTLNDLEVAIIRRFIVEKSVKIHDGDLPDAKVKSRDYSGAGFMTCLEHSEKLRVGNENDEYIFSHIGALLNGQVETGYLIYVESGYIDAVEGYTYAEDWPIDISEIEIYLIP